MHDEHDLDVNECILLHILSFQAIPYRPQDAKSPWVRVWRCFPWRAYESMVGDGTNYGSFIAACRLRRRMAHL